MLSESKEQILSVEQVAAEDEEMIIKPSAIASQVFPKRKIDILKIERKKEELAKTDHIIPIAKEIYKKKNRRTLRFIWGKIGSLISSKSPPRPLDKKEILDDAEDYFVRENDEEEINDDDSVSLSLWDLGGQEVF